MNSCSFYVPFCRGATERIPITQILSGWFSRLYAAFVRVWALALNLQHRAKMTHELSGGQAAWLHCRLPMFTQICTRKQMFIYALFCHVQMFISVGAGGEGGFLHLVNYIFYTSNTWHMNSTVIKVDWNLQRWFFFFNYIHNSFQKEYQWLYSLAQYGYSTTQLFAQIWHNLC